MMMQSYKNGIEVKNPVMRVDLEEPAPLDGDLKYCMVGKSYEVEDYNLTIRQIQKMYDTYIAMYICALPGPPHWNGPEGGCLGLPTDVAKMILTWL